MFGDEWQRRLATYATKAEEALELWLANVADLCVYPEETPFYPDGLEVATAALFDSEAAAALLYVLNMRDSAEGKA